MTAAGAAGAGATSGREGPAQLVVDLEVVQESNVLMHSAHMGVGDVRGGWMRRASATADIRGGVAIYL